MSHRIRTNRIVGLLAAIAVVSGAALLAQQPAQQGRGGQGRGGGGGTGAARASAAPLFFKVEWVRPPSQTGQTPVVQENVADANLELKWYGKAAKQLLTSGNPGSETTPFSVWSGVAEGPFAVTFRQKDNYVDLTGTSKVRWLVKTSGFHVVRPVVKLADGTMLIGEHASASVPMLVQSEFVPAAIRWVKLDPERVVTLGGTGLPFNEIWITNPDLSRVDEFGFADLMPGSGHGTGGYIHLGTIEVFGRAVPRAGTR